MPTLQLNQGDPRLGEYTDNGIVWPTQFADGTIFVRTMNYGIRKSKDRKFFVVYHGGMNQDFEINVSTSRSVSSPPTPSTSKKDS